jgi:lipopolysaccharide export system ATP-binding protein
MILLACFSSPLSAASARIHIQSEEATLDAQKGITIHRGHVIFSEGDRTLVADELQVYKSKKGTIQRVMPDSPKTKMSFKAIVLNMTFKTSNCFPTLTQPKKILSFFTQGKCRMLKASHLTKKYQKRTIVNKVSLHVNPGEIVGLLGPNGAGKTTCFYMIAGLVRCDEGEVFLQDEEISAYPIQQRAQKGLGYLPQEASVFRNLSVRDNLLAVLELQPDLSSEDRNNRADTLLEEFHLTQVVDTLGVRLSGGERRRVEIARALTRNPKFMLLDEPFAGVDPLSVIDIKNQVKHLASQGIGILITDHNVRETLDICDRAYILAQGEVLATGSPTEILAHPEVRAVYLGETF